MMMTTTPSPIATPSATAPTTRTTPVLMHLSAMTKPRRWQAGEGSISQYDTKTGARSRAQRAEISLSRAQDDGLILGTVDGATRHHEPFTRAWSAAVERAHRGLPDLPAIRLHDLRHTHATVMLAAGVPVKVVSDRVGHASATITLGVYAHVMPGMQAEAAAKFASLLAGEA